jgi:hypothetical protein
LSRPGREGNNETFDCRTSLAAAKKYYRQYLTVFTAAGKALPGEGEGEGEGRRKRIHYGRYGGGLAKVAWKCGLQRELGRIVFLTHNISS